MFVGHYSVSYALKRLDPEIKLSHLFTAVQFMDVAWSAFVLLGVEKLRIIPGFMKASALDLYFMPYTHSLEGSLLWSLLVGLAYYLFRRDLMPTARRKSALVMGGAVFSHWLLDLLVHGPDLGLVGDAHKVGLGLWNYPTASFLLEAGLFLGGLIYYLRGTRATSAVGRIGPVIFAGYLLVMNAADIFVLPHIPIPANLFAVAALGSYALFALLAGWLDRKRSANFHADAAESFAVA